MVKHNKKRPFVIVYLDLVENGLTYEESAIVRYVERFEQSQKPCFASIPYIAKDLRLAERTIRRHLRRLIDLEYLRATGKGRGRYLNINAAKMAGMSAANLATNTGQIVTDCGQNGRCDTGQNGRLSNSIMINSNINNTDQELLNIETQDAMKKEDEEKYQARLKQLQNESEGWEDKGNHLEKWDPESRTVLRKRKVVHEAQLWNGKTSHSDLPE